MRGLRKRYLVSEGDLMQLWVEVQQVRKNETRDRFKKEFKELLKNAQPVQLTVIKGKEGHNGS